MAEWRKNDKSWERLPNESVQAYEAFYKYLLMGEKRTLRKVEQELNKSHALIGRWSSTWNWQKRSADYDADLRRQEYEATAKEIKKMQERQVQTAMLLQKKAVQALDKLDINDLSPQEILRFISEGARLEKETRQEQLPVSDRQTESQSLANTIIAAYEKRKGGG